MVLIAFGCMAYKGATNINEWNVGWIPVTAELAMVVRLTGFKRLPSYATCFRKSCSNLANFIFLFVVCNDSKEKQ